MMATLNDIPITYINETGKSNFGVAVFAEEVAEGPSQQPVVWEMLRTQSSAQFIYPAKVAVGAEWTLHQVKNLDGPFDAQFGSTWNLRQPVQDGTPLLTPDNKSVLSVSDSDVSGVIIINNVKPDSWSGRAYDFGLFKNDRMIVVRRQVGVEGNAYLSLTTVLNFGIVPSTYELAVGDVLDSLQGIEYINRVDLSKYSSGLTITLTYNAANASYTFTPSNTPVMPTEKGP